MRRNRSFKFPNIFFVNAQRISAGFSSKMWRSSLPTIASHRFVLIRSIRIARCATPRSFFSSKLSFLSYFYSLYPGERTEMHYFQSLFLDFYLTLLLINEKRLFVRLVSSHPVRLELFQSDLLGALIIFLILLLIELLNWIRLLVIRISQEKIRNERIFWLLNIFVPSLNGKRCLAQLLKSSVEKFRSPMSKDEALRSRLDLVGKGADEHCSVYSLRSDKSILLNAHQRGTTRRTNSRRTNERTNQPTALLANGIFDSPLLLLDIARKTNPLKSNLAIDHLSFCIKWGQCFSLLGFNNGGLAFRRIDVKREETAKITWFLEWFGSNEWCFPCWLFSACFLCSLFNLCLVDILIEKNRLDLQAHFSLRNSEFVDDFSFDQISSGSILAHDH